MLIIETGAGLTNSNSYASLAAANAYFTDRAVAEWTGTDAAKSAALIRATDYIDAYYVFRSVRTSDDQALENPRYGVDGLPASLVKATIELALHALTQDLFAAEVERDILSTEQSLGSLSKKVTYADRRNVDRYPAITKTLKAIASRRGASASSTMMGS